MGYFALPPKDATVEQLVETAEANIKLWRNKQPERGYEYLLSIASDQLDRAGSDEQPNREGE